MKLTKRKALKLCLELWEWLEENPSKCKDDWPRWKYRDGNVPYMVSHCPCCAYDQQKPRTITCSACPLLGYWTKNDKKLIKISDSPCIEPESPFELWDNNHWDDDTDIKLSKKYASQMVKITKLALAKLPPLKGDRL